MKDPLGVGCLHRIREAESLGDEVVIPAGLQVGDVTGVGGEFGSEDRGLVRQSSSVSGVGAGEGAAEG